MLQEEDLLIDYLLNDINYFEEDVFLTGGKRRKSVDCASWVTNNGSEEDFSPNEIHLAESSSSSSPTSLSSSSNQRRPFGPLSAYQTQKQQQKRIVLPKILKSDIRRKFLIMFANVMNSYDFSLMSSFFKAFCVSDLSLFNVKNDCCPPHLYGRDLVADYFSSLLKLSPDKVFRVFDIKLRQRSDFNGKTEVYCDFTIDKTAFYDANPLKVANYLLQSYANLSPSSDQAWRSESLASNRGKKRKLNTSSEAPVILDTSYQKDPHFLYHADNFPLIFPRLSEPFSFQITGTFCLLVNEAKRIESITCQASCPMKENCPKCCKYY
jgi:hypothetical protein